MSKSIARKKNDFKLFLVFTSVVFLTLFLLFSFLVSQGNFITVDTYINEVFGYKLRGLFYLYSKILEYLYIFLSFLFFRLIYKFYKRGEKMESLLLIITAVASLFAQFFVKPIFSVLCPGSYYNSVFTTYKLIAKSNLFQRIALNETCYPSNHTIAYIVICGYLALLMKVYFPKKKSTNSIVFALLFVIATVGITRVYLHVHWFSDVIAGYFLGGFFLSIIFLVRLFKTEIRHNMKVIYEKLEKTTRK